MSRDPSTTDDTERDGRLDRRGFLLSTGVLASGALADTAGASRTTVDGGTASPVEKPAAGIDDPDHGPFEERFSGLSVVAWDPVNAEAADRSTYTRAITPPEEHYVRNNYEPPAIEADEWTIDLGGLGVEEGEIGMAELREFETESVAHTMQCAGDGRSFFEPEVDGTPWTIGALGTTVWSGVPVSTVLDEYGTDEEEGSWLMVAGGDHPEGEDVFARSIPTEKIREDCVLAYEMDGRPLPPEHGYPVRLIVPGWYGHNSIKWVAEIEVLDRIHGGEEWAQYTEWQHDDYRMFTAGRELGEQEDIDEFEYDTRRAMDADAAGEIDYPPYIYDQLVQSVIGSPGEGDTVCPRPQDGCIEVLGVAWAGDDRVETVEVSTDGGDTWSEAEFFGPDRGRFAWRQFRYLWDASTGDHTVVSRATDEHGRSQPLEVAHRDEGLQTITDEKVPWNEGGACNSASIPRGVEVTVVER